MAMLEIDSAVVSMVIRSRVLVNFSKNNQFSIHQMSTRNGYCGPPQLALFRGRTGWKGGQDGIGKEALCLGLFEFERSAGELLPAVRFPQV